jgi:hypothetical protein
MHYVRENHDGVARQYEDIEVAGIHNVRFAANAVFERHMWNKVQMSCAAQRHRRSQTAISSIRSGASFDFRGQRKRAGQ